VTVHTSDPTMPEIGHISGDATIDCWLNATKNLPLFTRCGVTGFPAAAALAGAAIVGLSWLETTAAAGRLRPFLTMSPQRQNPRCTRTMNNVFMERDRAAEHGEAVKTTAWAKSILRLGQHGPISQRHSL